MSTTESPHTHRAVSRGDVRIVIAARADDEQLQACLGSIVRHSPADDAPVRVEPSVEALNAVLDELAPADVVIIDSPCRVTPGWLEHLQEAARADSNTATASALADAGTRLAILESSDAQAGLATLAEDLASRALRLRPRLERMYGPAIYVRRQAIELVGALDEELELVWSLEVDFAQRCIRSGLAHVAADDALVQPLAPHPSRDYETPPPTLLERYPSLSDQTGPPLPESSVLIRALEAARSPQRRLWVTLDARALEGSITGTQVNILELILALARRDELRLRLLVRPSRIDSETLALLRGLPSTEILAEEDIEPSTPVSTIFHRPQQAFAPEDVELALGLGERIVLSQLDLIAYRNPGYFENTAAWEAYRRASRHGLSAAERVVVFSDHTRRELLSDALVEDERIRIIPPGLDHRADGEPRRPSELCNELPQAGFLLCLGTDFTHKNRVFALRLLAALRSAHSWRGALVLAGTHIQHGSSQAAERDFLASRPELSAHVISIGAVSEEEKRWLVGQAEAVLYPSAYEGFGLVPFESALGGVPCVFAAQSSLAEAAPAGTASIVPWDPAGSADTVHELLTNPDARARHVEALSAAAHSLTWDATAAAILEVYREAAVAPVRDAGTLSRDLVTRERVLTAAHQMVAARLIGEREHAQRMYDELNFQVGSGLSLIGPNGTLPENLQRALLTVSSHPAVSRPLYGLLARCFVAARGVGRLARRLRPRS
ncbi:MAG TPA: glycosyltransferase [Solirubrobacteraceae bacterium]|jgi:glycosyltransferase involved in cell wall biosynthesis|nr:glycosyltransferase [Solirubrobacteraceae bacterium]